MTSEENLLKEKEKEANQKEYKPLNPRITNFNDAPKHLQRNKFIQTGYRVDYDFLLAIKSLFQTHNELINSWSHIYGTLIFLLFTLYTLNVFYENYSKVDFGDILVWTIYMISVLNTFISSTVYHLFGLCHHDTKIFRVCYCMDVSAVGGIVCGSFFPGYYYWMYKHENWRIIYISIFGVFMFLAMGFPYASGILPKKLFENLRTTLFVGMIVAGVGPLVHLHLLDGGYVTYERTKFVLYGCINMGLFYGIGIKICTW
eukprot:gene9029-1127_t